METRLSEMRRAVGERRRHTGIDLIEINLPWLESPGLALSRRPLTNFTSLRTADGLGGGIFSTGA